MARPRLKTYFTDNTEEIQRIIRENPKNAFSTISKAILKEAEQDVPVRTGRLKKSLGYWAKLNVKEDSTDLMLGFLTTAKKNGTSYSHLVFPDSETNPITRTVFKNKDAIAQAIADSIKPYLNAKLGGK